MNLRPSGNPKIWTAPLSALKRLGGRQLRRQKVVLANRADGLGERLCALINGIRLADALQLDFRLAWTPEVWNPDYDRYHTGGERPILGQSICAGDRIFSTEFLQRHATDYVASDPFRPLPRNGDLSDGLIDPELRGWIVDRLPLETSFTPDFLKLVRMSAEQAFQKIGFTDEVERVIAHARSIDIGDFVAIHLRSGDMTYGEVRKWGFWGTKVLNPLIAMDQIERAYSKGERVALFGQDVKWLAHMRDRFGVYLPHDICSEHNYRGHLQALFELTLMARARLIIAGDSGFARAAAMMGGTQLRGLFDLYSAIGYSQRTLEGLAACTDHLDPLMAAYSYWQAYAFGRRQRSIPELIGIINSARELDADNELYSIINIALLYRAGDDSIAERLLNETLSKYSDRLIDQEHPVVRQLLFRYGTPKFTHEEQFDDLLGAARRPGNLLAKTLARFIRSRNSPA